MRDFSLQALLPNPFVCGECAARLAQMVAREPGVIESTHDVGAGVLHVVFDREVTADDALAERVELLARAAANAVEHAAYRVTGLD